MERKMVGLMTGHSKGKIVYRGNSGTFYKLQNIPNTIFRSSIYETTIEKVSKNGIGKHWLGLSFSNILKFVISFPLLGKIFFAFF
jgi:hypothetical protein